MRILRRVIHAIRDCFKFPEDFGGVSDSMDPFRFRRVELGPKDKEEIESLDVSFHPDYPEELPKVG